MTTEQLTTAATLGGASGVRAFLFENRAGLRDLLEELGSPAFLGHGSSSVRAGLRVETLPLVVQRELWSAFVQWRTALPTDALAALVERFLLTAEKRTDEMDNVSVHLARVLEQILHEERNADDCDDDMSLGESDEIDRRLQAVVFLPTLAPASRRSEATENRRVRKRRRSSADDPTAGATPQDTQREREEIGPTDHQVTLPPDVEVRAAAIATQLVLLGSPDVSADHSSKASELATLAITLLHQVMNQVHATQHDNEVLFQLACVKLQLSATSDDALFQITNGLMDANWSSRYAAIYLDAAILPRVVSATSVISRVLLQTILLYGKPSFTAALTDGLLVPLLSMLSMGPSQGEAVTRLLREKCIPMDQVDSVLRRSLESKVQALLTNEAAILVFQNALNMKPTLSASTIELLVGAIASALEHEPARETLRKSPKFASLLFTLVTKYSAQCSSHTDDLQAIATQLTSVMAKSALRSIQKLKKP